MENREFFKKPLHVFLLAMLCCTLWGSAAPFIKWGYKLFNIEGVPSILMFAGIRFTLAGFLVILFGSFLQKKVLVAKKENIQGIYILEMIGYFDSNLVQEYPMGLKWLYPSHGNFIATVGNLQSREMTADYCNAMKNLNQLQCERIIAPSFVQSMDFSDHLNYWNLGYPAMLITDTGSYRNKNYHTDQDRIETLDVGKMAQVVNGLVNTILKK